MSVPLRTLAVIALSLAALRPVWAQEKPPTDPKQDAPAPAPAEDAASALTRLADLYPRVLQQPPETEIALAPDAKARTEAVKRMEAWRKTVEQMNQAGDAYARALGDAAPDANGLYYRGFAKAVAVKFAPTAQVRPMCDAAADALGRYLGAADEKSAYRTDAEMHLGLVLLMSGKLDEAIPHLGRAVDLLQKESRHDDAGRCAADGLKSLRQPGREEEFHKFADAVHAADADFGVLTQVVREHVAAARFTVGAPLPALPETKDVDGKPVSWRPGKPMLLHFFLTAQITGDATSFREIELEVRPLWEKYREKGLAVVGVSMDYELPAGEAERKRKQYEEWGVKKEVRDGTLASVREWAVKQQIEWPWCWDGKAWKCPLSVALGGVAHTQPFAVLVEKDGIVRWKSDAPFTGLPEALAKLLP
jgi:tetratricopeptide (TPR) repeat protein